MNLEVKLSSSKAKYHQFYPILLLSDAYRPRHWLPILLDVLMKVKIYEFWDGIRVLVTILRNLVWWWNEVRRNHRKRSIDEGEIQEFASKKSSIVIWVQPSEGSIYLYEQAMRIQ